MSQISIPSHTTRESEKTGPLLASLGLFIGLTMLVVHIPLLYQLGKRMWSLEHYQFFPIILVGAVWLAFRGYSNLEYYKPGKLIWRSILWVMALFTFLIAVRMRSPWAGAISVQVAGWAVCCSSGGKRLCRAMWPAWLFLWLAVPLPLGIDMQLIQKLQSIATVWASSTLDLLGYHHLVEGVTVLFPERSFLVEEACSGVHSLFAALACTMFYLLQSNRGFIRSFFLLLAAIFWVIVANAFRVFLVTVLSIQWDLPVTEGWRHDLVGLLVFVVSLLLIVSTDRLFIFFAPVGIGSSSRFGQWLKRIFRFGKSEEYAQPKIEQRGLLTKIRSGYRITEAVAVIGIFLLLGMGQFISFAKASGTQKKKRAAINEIVKIEKEFFPTAWNGWKLIAFEERNREAGDVNGQHSSIWHYQKGALKAAVSIDGPFVGWHNLNSCLAGQGWETLENNNQKFSELSDQLPGGFTNLNIRNGVSRHASVLFSVFDDNKVALDPPDTYLSFRAIRRFPGVGEFVRKITGEAERNQDGRQDSRTMQLQVFSESYLPLTEPEHEQLRELFSEMTARYTSQNTSPSRGDK